MKKIFIILLICNCFAGCCTKKKILKYKMQGRQNFINQELPRVLKKINPIQLNKLRIDVHEKIEIYNDALHEEIERKFLEYRQLDAR